MKVAYLIEPPFNYLDDGRNVTGCDVELVRHVFHQLGVSDVVFVQAEFADLLPGLARGDWQMTTGLFATRTRQRVALFSRPIWALADGLLIRSADAGRIHGYRSLADDETLTLAVIRDQAQHQTARDLGVASDRITVFESYVEAAQAVRDGLVSAYASVANAHEAYLEQNADAGLNSVIVPSSEKQAAYGCFGFASTDADLKDSVDGVLNRFIGSMEHRQLMWRFGFTEEDVDHGP